MQIPKVYERPPGSNPKENPRMSKIPDKVPSMYFKHTYKNSSPFEVPGGHKTGDCMNNVIVMSVVYKTVGIVEVLRFNEECIVFSINGESVSVNGRVMEIWNGKNEPVRFFSENELVNLLKDGIFNR